MKFRKTMSKCLIGILLSTLVFVPISKVHADAFKVVTLGADLTAKQKQDMLKYFGASKEDSNILEVRKQEEDKYLGGVASKKQIGTKSISCAYVEPTSEGGLNISTHNIYWVTDNMIKNALITAGIENANVKAAAPFNVSGTAALTGILKGFENSNGGKKIDENKKKAANEEVVVTGNIGEKIGQEDAANLINDVKKDVIKKKPKSEKQIEKIVTRASEDYESKLNDKDIKQITELMTKINKLDLNYNKLKQQLNNISKQLEDKVSKKDAKNFLTKMWKHIRSFFDDLLDTQDENANTKVDDKEK